MIALQNVNISLWKVSYSILRFSYAELLVFNKKISRPEKKEREKKKESRSCYGYCQTTSQLCKIKHVGKFPTTKSAWVPFQIAYIFFWQFQPQYSDGNLITYQKILK